MTSVEIEQVSKRFGNTVALDQITMKIDAGQLLALLGPSGAGKTTLLRLVAGLDRPDHGVIRLASQDSSTGQPNVGLVSQDFALYPRLTVRKNAEMALKRLRLAREEIAKRVDDTLERIGISEFADRLPDQLSGGQAQRAAFARALVSQPDLLLLDEPLSHVDSIQKAPLLDLIDQVRSEFEITLILVTHTAEDALRLATDIAVLDQGKLIELGPKHAVYQNPNSRIAAELCSPLGITWLDAKHVKDNLTRSEVANPADAATENTPVHCGFRPEDWCMGDTAADALLFKATVRSDQFLGYAHLVTADSSMGLVRFLTRERLSIGDVIAGYVPREQLLWVTD